ncbi:glycosyltransferase family 4 protein [Blastococcus montanus]|uniref:glycosyltransferase family 4 protein n=1 Tax=Blastococcus montanus TaxID=3144973 RepID=UPI00320B02D9
MKIALYHHTPSNPDAGASRVYHVLSAGLQEAGHEVRVMHLDDMGAPRSQRGQLILTRFALPQFVSANAWADRAADDDVVMSSSGMCFPFFRRLRRLGRRRPLLVNHLHGLTSFDHAANTTEAQVGHWPTSVPYRLITGPLPVRWDRAGVLSSDLTVVQNHRDLGDVRVFAPETTAVELVPPSVHPDILAASDAMAPIERRDGHSILWFGTWESRKGSYYVPSAFRDLRREFPGARLTIGGTGKGPAELLRDFDPADRGSVNILGRISRSEHIDVMNQHAIFLFPSLSEGFGLALPEAQSMGLAAVTTNTAFGGDYLADGVSARITAPSSVHLARALGDLMRDSAHRTSIASRGRDVARGFTQDRMVRAYVEVFERHIQRLAEEAGGPERW